MLTTKRVLIATILGLIFGFVCMGFAMKSPDITTNVLISIVASRTLMGFIIGISALKLNWWLHGIILGFIASIPMALPILDDIKIAIYTVVMGVIYGFLIELFTSVVFKAKSVGTLGKSN